MLREGAAKNCRSRGPIRHIPMACLPEHDRQMLCVSPLVLPSIVRTSSMEVGFSIRIGPLCAPQHGWGGRRTNAL
jgi:hypothetical protein